MLSFLKKRLLAQLHAERAALYNINVRRQMNAKTQFKESIMRNAIIALLSLTSPTTLAELQDRVKTPDGKKPKQDQIALELVAIAADGLLIIKDGGYVKREKPVSVPVPPAGAARPVTSAKAGSKEEKRNIVLAAFNQRKSTHPNVQFSYNDLWKGDINLQNSGVGLAMLYSVGDELVQNGTVVKLPNTGNKRWFKWAGVGEQPATAQSAASTAQAQDEVAAPPNFDEPGEPSLSDNENVPTAQVASEIDEAFEGTPAE